MAPLIYTKFVLLTVVTTVLGIVGGQALWTAGGDHGLNRLESELVRSIAIQNKNLLESRDHLGKFNLELESK